MERLRLAGGGLAVIFGYSIGAVVTFLIYGLVGWLSDVAYDRGLWLIGAPLRVFAIIMLLGVLFELLMIAWLVARGLLYLVRGR